jgi:hypothetical protein
MAKAKRDLIGRVGVDSGLMYIGDPCYVIDKPLGQMDWGEFLNMMYGGRDPDVGLTWIIENGTAIVSSTGYGDGEYPVYAEYKDGRVARIIIDFMSKANAKP